MLRQLEISRFKSIRSQKLEFGRVNLFIGGNGSGKSNILEAIGLTSACIDQGFLGKHLARKGIRLSSPELMKSAFKNTELPKTFDFKAIFDEGLAYNCKLTSSEYDPFIRFHSETCIFDNIKQFSRSGAGATVVDGSTYNKLDKYRGMWDQIKIAFPFDKILVSIFDEFARYAIYTPQTDVLRGKHGGPFDMPPIGLNGEGLPNAVLGLLRSRPVNYLADPIAAKQKGDFIQEALNLAFLPKWTSTVKVGFLEKSLVSQDIANPSENMVYFIDKYMHGKRNTLSAYDSSEGTLFLLFVAVLLAHPEAPRYFALDNIDNALNPRMTRKLVETIIKLTDEVHKNDYSFGPQQVFLTSHNPTSLDAFDLFDQNHRVFVVKRNEKGHTVAEQLKPKEGMTREDWSIAMEGKNLSQMWLDGMISGALGNGEI